MRKNMDKKFLISGGGTGGHIYPAIAIADEIKERFSNSKIFIFLDLGNLQEESPSKNFWRKKIPVFVNACKYL